MELLFISQNNIKVKYEIKQLYLNNNLEDSWYPLKNNSVASFKQVFFKIILETNETKYFILKNVFISYLDKNIVIRFSDQFNVYITNKDQTVLKTNKAKLNELRAKAKYLEATLALDLDLKNETEFSVLKSKIFKLTAITYFDLAKEGVINEKKVK
ncbi:MSC_0621 family F1-like ATPase epsilon subunit [[Mycoplasma] anseris]|uniref:Uncharacterized protein n=1 Tax=[Mycoplasma] anseris TaxID=92400 RepID=A0A2Z4NCU4_9BACT|nr:hypothetical protein [[Mycoplasma] anseris]AWX69394.1 hypothetical protein DP065_01330 [[Mycoplasma] anseris]